MNKRRFTIDELNLCWDLFSAAFDRASFELLLEARLDKRLEDLVPNIGFKAQLRKVIVEANAKYWHYQLLDAAIAEVPDDPDLLNFAQQFQLTARSAGSLEKLVQHSKILDMRAVLMALARIERQVCQVQSPPGTAVGTGFLVAKDLVMTNYHVLEPLQKAQITKDHVAFRFDYRTNLEDEPVADGTVVYPKDNDGLVEWRKYHENDLEATPLNSNWPAEALDFALIRLSDAIGENPAGTLSNPQQAKNSPTRGWLAPAAGTPLVPGLHLFIAQHPKQEPISIAFGTLSTPAANGNFTRIRYTTSTLPGSSGSPCFDGGFKLIALHHASDSAEGQWGKTNQGIPIQSILKYLQVSSFEEI